MQKELENNGTAMGEQLLKIVDFLVASLPDRFGNQVLHASDQHIFVMRTIEDTDAAFAGRVFMHAPQEIMRQIFLSRLLEGMHVAALLVDAAEHMPDGAILA